MNRTQRAIKRQNRKILNDKKREKRNAVHAMTTTYSMYGGSEQKRAAECAKDEKALRAWHRKILNDYICQNNTLEVAEV